MAFAAALAAPATLAKISAVSMLVSTGIAVISAVRQGQAQEAAANYNATISAQNADISRADAAMEATQIQRENALRLGAIRANQGASGGAAGEGSVLDVLGDVAAQGELERQFVLYQGEQRARGFTNTAQLDRYSGRQARSASYMRAGTELLSGGAKVAYTRTVLSRTGGATNSGYSDFVSGYNSRNYG